MTGSAPRARWLEAAQVARAEGGEEALALLRALPPPARREVLEAGERVAATSLAAAQAYAVAAPRVRRDLGARAFHAWATLGAEVAGPKLDGREAAVAYFRLDPAGVIGLERRLRRRWIDLCAEVHAVSRRLAASCLEASGRVLPSLGEAAAPRLEAWVRSGLGLAAGSGWRGEFLAGAWFGAGERWLPRLDPPALEALAALATAVQTGRELQLGLLERVPEGFDALDGDERERLLALGRAASASAAGPARELFGTLPRALAGFTPPVRRAILEGFTAAAGDPVALVSLVPLLSAILRVLPGPGRERLVRRAARVARRFPPGYPRLLRSLARAAGETDAEGVAAWIDRGLSLAEDNPAAGAAYFALESRTSLQVLRATSSAARFEDVQGILRSYARMLGAVPLVLRSGDGPSLRPFLDRESLDGSNVALPARVDLFDSWEENFALLKLMTANGVARLAFGTLDLSVSETTRRLPASLASVLRVAVTGDDLASLLDSVPDADPLIPLFAGVEGARLDVRLRAIYRGYDAELRAAARGLRRRGGRRALSPELILFLLGAGEAPGGLATRELPASVLGTVAAVVGSPEAGPEDSLAAAILLRERLGDSLGTSGVGPVTTYEELLFEKMTGETIFEAGPGEPEAGNAGGGAREVLDLEPAGIEEGEEEGRGTPLSAEELRRLLEAGALVRVGHGAADRESAGIFARGLSIAADGDAEEEAGGAEEEGSSRSSKPTVRGGFEYDEWDYEITDYRRRWCLLEEVVLPGDAGEFFQQTLERYADLLPEVRRQFQRIRPERYRKVRGLEDGEDFDLNAVVEARVDLRARRVPSSRLYVARHREERDVATLFLLDMSASTDEVVNPPGDGAPARHRRSRRIIDITKEALVIMAEALDELGDRYAIYGFSGQGRRNVEMYPVKRFSDGLTPGVRGRIGGIEPRRSTRMGTALRHAMTKLSNLPARSKHILLLSDGFPQDFDYGNDRRSNAYGIQDTMMALQECQAAGISPFCITVDKTGHDYLREMCESSRYLVIEDVTSLPAELPKIYERWVASRS